MSSFSFLHAADLHLDTPFSGISNISPAISQDLYKATAQSFSCLIDYAINRKVNFICFSGDIFNSADQSIRAQYSFAQGLHKLKQHAIAAFIVTGNHDPRESWSTCMEWPSNVTLFDAEEPGLKLYPSADAPLARIIGLSFSRDKAGSFKKIFPFRKKNTDMENLFTIGMFHASIGHNPDHAQLEPAQLSDLVNTGYDYWALGHIHKHQILSHSPFIVYPGCTQGLNPKELGYKGFMHIQVKENKIDHAAFINSSTIIWEALQIDISQMDTINAVIDAAATAAETLHQKYSRPLIFRLNLLGSTPLYNQLQSPESINDIYSILIAQLENIKPFLWCESVSNSTSPECDYSKLAGQDNLFGDLLRLFKEYQNSSEKLSELKAGLSPLFSHPQIKHWLEDLDEAKMQHILSQAEKLHLQTMANGENL